MTRRITTVVALLCIAVAAVTIAGAYLLGRDDGQPAEVALPKLDAPGGAPSGAPSSVPSSVPSGADGPVRPRGADDGDLDDRTVSVDSEQPAVSRLDPALLAALRDAARAASADGVEVRVTSGWRSREYQERLLDEAIAKYGSREEALRWVATPDASAHTTGLAVDVGPTDAAYWMSEHGSRFGLCQTFANEVWHYELLTSPGGTCPPPLVDGNS